MFAYQVGRVGEPGTQGGLHSFAPGCVTQAHCQVAQPALIADAADRAASGLVEEILLAPGEQRHQAGPIEIVARSEVLFCRGAGEASKGTHQLAVVAAKYPVAHGGPIMLGDGTKQLDGEIGDAGTGIDDLVVNDRASGTGGTAGAAAAAVFILEGRIDR